MTPASHLPLWVPVLLAVLLVVGWQQSQPRQVKPKALVVVAAVMAGLSLRSVMTVLGVEPLVLALWLGGYGLAVAAGARYFGAQGWVARGEGSALRVHVPGSWVPMGLIVAIFAANTGLNVARALHLPLLQDALAAGVVAAVVGVLSGGFGARALAVLRCAQAGRQEPGLPAAA
ncbi:DUF6622 family protein [Ideonella livida]|uniref:DUF1453 domain-containing protein n=1 Tax=Ideonella livida TaxID=2707176 RepID=A0A7C9TKM3_9BURK|nr:DUF6622 family protein [Ideonella livida]NDY91864.1 hypothetical protein [Ideonella livida]